jgi:hypothetical protein
MIAGSSDAPPIVGTDRKPREVIVLLSMRSRVMAALVQCVRPARLSGKALKRYYGDE